MPADRWNCNLLHHDPKYEIYAFASVYPHGPNATVGENGVKRIEVRPVAGDAAWRPFLMVTSEESADYALYDCIGLEIRFRERRPR
jgi:hypothetical protein